MVVKKFLVLIVRKNKNALISIENLFNKLPSKKKGFPVPLNSVHYNEETIINQFENIENITYKDNAVHYAIFKWISKFDVSNEYAYNYWKRFVYNILNNAPFENHAYEIIRSAKMFSSILDGITEDVSKESVLRAIINYFDNNKDTIISIIKSQYEEETIKAKLILESPDWECLILEAEEYFKDGQIVFILDLSKNDDNTYDLGKFEKALRKCKSVFNNKKEICDDKQKKLFEKSLLICNILSDNKPSDGYAHLLSKAQSNGHRFPYGDYKSSLSIYLKNKDHKKYGLIIALLKAIIDSNLDFQETMNKYLMDNQNAIRNYNGWERHFIENDNLFGCEFTDSKTFSNYIQIVDNYVLMLSGTSIKSLSIELNTLLLFQSIKTHLPNARLSLNSDYALTDEFSFPRRYIVLQDYYVGYYNGEFIVFKENTQIKRFDCMQTCKEYLLNQG